MPEIRSQADHLREVRAKVPPTVDERFAALENSQIRTMLAVEALARKDSSRRDDDDRRDRHDDDDRYKALHDDVSELKQMVGDLVKRDSRRRDKRHYDDDNDEPAPMAADDDKRDDAGAEPENAHCEELREEAEGQHEKDDRRDDRRDRRHDTRADARRRHDQAEIDLYEAQTQYNEAYSAIEGKQAPKPISGHSARTYRLYCATPLQKYCDDWKNVDLAKLAKNNPDVFAVADAKIRADAIRIGSDPQLLQQHKSDGHLLREVRRQDRTGRWISEFVGPVNAPNGTLAPFRMQPFRVRGINPTPNDPRTW